VCDFEPFITTNKITITHIKNAKLKEIPRKPPPAAIKAVLFAEEGAGAGERMGAGAGEGEGIIV